VTETVNQEGAESAKSAVEVAPMPSASGDAQRPQIVDPAVSHEKFDREIAEFRRLEVEHRRRGWWLLEALFPRVFVVFATPQLRPPAVICGVDIDFTNYDLEPPSVRLVEPFTREPYRQSNLPTALLRRQVMNFALGPGMQQFAGAVPLMQAHAADDVPFLCIAGVWEYHAHPAHSGDSWLMHRGLGAGTLFHILNTIYQYGVQPITGYGIGHHVVGFEQSDPPA
jgi:hypothetical protein